MAIDLSEHTMIIHKRISALEARHLCSLYGKSLSKNVEVSGNDIKIAGINQINIKGSKIPDSGIWTYDVMLIINVGRLIKRTKVAMLILNKNNVSAIIKQLDEIFTRCFSFKPKNCDSTEWHIKRFDCGIDLKLGTDEELVLKAYIRALHTSFDCNNSRGIRYSKYNGYDNPSVQFESITLEMSGYLSGNPLYKYNIYYKRLQLLKYAQEHGISVSQEELDEIRNVIRIEKQIEDVSKVFGGSNKLGLLMNPDVTEKAMNNIRKEIKLFFGTGDYLTYEEGVERILASNYEQKTKNAMSVVYAFVNTYSYSELLENLRLEIKNQGGYEEDVVRKYREIAQVRKKIESLGMSVVSVHNMESMKGISTLLDEEFALREKPRKKSLFAEIKPIIEPSGNVRFMCKPTIQMADGTVARTSIASSVGGTREECEKRVFDRIRQNLNTYYKSLKGMPHKQIKCCEGANQDFSKFRTIVKSEIIIEEIDKIQNKINERIKKKQKELGI